MGIKTALAEIDNLRNLAYREHYECEDEFYSCAKVEGSYSPYRTEQLEQVCTCGADDHNNKVNEVYIELLELLQE